jgi:hypothetical protein
MLLHHQMFQATSMQAVKKMLGDFLVVVHSDEEPICDDDAIGLD